MNNPRLTVEHRSDSMSCELCANAMCAEFVIFGRGARVVLLDEGVGAFDEGVDGVADGFEGAGGATSGDASVESFVRQRDEALSWFILYTRED